MTPFAILAPGQILFGRGEAAKAPALIRSFGARVLVVHGADARRADWLRLPDAEVQRLPCAGEPTLPMLEAALESVGFQTRDLLEAMRADWGTAADGVLRVDGGMVASDWAMQFLADILGAPVDRPVVTETTALGAAYLAGLQAGLCPAPEEFQKSWALQRRFAPAMAPEVRAAKYARWGRAVAATMAV